jgi:hypothetical protein
MENKQVTLGQYSTPLRYVAVISDWLADYIDSSYVILDSSCGYGVFSILTWEYPSNRFVGADIDNDCVELNRRRHSRVSSCEFYFRNSLSNVSRRVFNISPKSKLCIVGNPPYNDRTSQAKLGQKGKFNCIDSDIKTRDLGLSFLNSYNKLKADIVVILHPLSYLIKPTNRNLAKQFFDNYTLEKHIILNSNKFRDIQCNMPFPILLGLYVRSSNGTNNIEQIHFKTEEGQSFKLSDWSFISSYCTKYPNKNSNSSGYYFYTMRDVNALKRNKTFVQPNTKNAIDIDRSKLGYYCYADLFKRISVIPYWMGNFDIPLPKTGLNKSELEICTKYSQYLNPLVFGNKKSPTVEEIQWVRKMIDGVCSPSI